MAEDKTQNLMVELRNMSPVDRVKAVETAAKQLSKDEQKEVAKQLGEPDQATTNHLWLIVIAAFGAAMILAVLILGLSVFVPIQTAGAKPELILTVFTTVTGFLAGLFAPSPTD